MIMTVFFAMTVAFEKDSNEYKYMYLNDINSNNQR